MPTVHDILSSKDSNSVHTIAPTASVLDAVEAMNNRRIGALLVTEEGQLAGIFTERDVLQRVIGAMRRPSTTTINEVMSREVVSVGPDTDLDEVSSLMKERRIRHVPVRDDAGRILGMISIGDINALHATHRDAALTYLNDYVYGRA
jgi:CBS domain-containing protein